MVSTFSKKYECLPKGKKNETTTPWSLKHYFSKPPKNHPKHKTRTMANQLTTPTATEPGGASSPELTAPSKSSPLKPYLESSWAANGRWKFCCWTGNAQESFAVCFGCELWSKFFLDKTAILHKKQVIFRETFARLIAEPFCRSLSPKKNTFANPVRESFADHFWSTSMVILY